MWSRKIENVRAAQLELARRVEIPEIRQRMVELAEALGNISVGVEDMESNWVLPDLSRQMEASNVC
jgi:hypothetical protein